MHEKILQALQEARLKRQELGIKIVVRNPIEKSRDNPKSLRLAINGKCFDCQGGGRDPGTKEAIRDCFDKECCLYEVRPYQKIGKT